jgi:hypothetical protein
VSLFSLSLRETTAWMQEVEQRREWLPRAGVRAKQRKNGPHLVLLPRGIGIYTSPLSRLRERVRERAIC